jgi:hypothetical protein
MPLKFEPVTNFQNFTILSVKSGGSLYAYRVSDFNLIRYSLNGSDGREYVISLED